MIMLFMLTAGFLYTAGSWSLWRRKPGVLVDFGLGLILNIAVDIVVFLDLVPAAAQLRSPVFYLHIIGMLGFLGIMIYIARGDRRTYPRLGRAAMFGIWPTWVIGAILGFIHTLG